MARAAIDAPDRASQPVPVSVGVDQGTARHRIIRRRHAIGQERSGAREPGVQRQRTPTAADRAIRAEESQADGPGRQGLEWQLSDMRFKRGIPARMIRGGTPASNQLAVNSIWKVGSDVVGIIPDAAYPDSTDTSHTMIYPCITKDSMRGHIMTSDFGSFWGGAAGSRRPAATLS